MQFFRADYIHPQKCMAYTTDSDKVTINLSYIKALNDTIHQKKRISPGEQFTQITVAGRWLVVYTTNGINEEDTMMYFIDFRLDLDDSAIAAMVSANTLGNMKILQFRYDEVYKATMDIFEVSYCEAGEQILKPNLVSCDDDGKVLEKAGALGALLNIQTLKEPDKLKVCLVDEKIQEGDLLTINMYGLIHFGKTAEEDTGFAYLKLYDLLNNIDLAEDFLDALEKLGGKFDRVIFMEKFKRERWN